MADLILEVLREIRDEGMRTNVRLDGALERLDALGGRQTVMEMRLATELIAVAGAVRELRDAVLEDRKLREQVLDHEVRLRQLEG